MGPSERRSPEETGGPVGDTKGAVRQQFGSVAAHYATSPVHRGGPDLDALVDALPLDGERILDVGCGTGHTSLAVARRAASVAGLDLTEEMLASL